MAYPFRDETPARATTWGTWGLCIVCLVVFAFAQPKPMQGLTRGLTVTENAAAELEIRDFQDRWALVPCEVTHNRSMAAGAACNGYPVDRPDAYAAHKNIWIPFIVAMFLHADVLHLLGNLLFLWVFGRGLEERIGSLGVVGLFLAGGIAAFLGYIATNQESAVPVLGASGAVAALMGACLVLHPLRRMLSVVYAAGLQVIYLPTWALLGFFVVSEFFTSPGSQVAWQAHVAGIAFGAGVAAIWRWWKPARLDLGPSVPEAAAADTAAPRSTDPVPVPVDWPSTPPHRPPVH